MKQINIEIISSQMSQDILAAFGDLSATTAKPGSSADNSNNAPSFSFFDDFNSNSTNTNTTAQNTTQNFTRVKKSTTYRDDAVTQENEDDWGDFESTAENLKTTTASAPIASQFSKWLDEEDDGFPDYDERNATNKTQKWDFTKPDQPAPSLHLEAKPTKPAPKPQPQPKDPNVLFDVEDEQAEEDDDEFGEFERADEDLKKPSGVVDLLGMDSAAPPTPQKHISKAQVLGTSSSLLDLEDLSLNNEATNAWRTNNIQPPIHGFGTLGSLATPAPSASRTQETSNRHGQRNESLPMPSLTQTKSPSVESSRQPSAPAEDEETWDEFEAWEEGPIQVTPAAATAVPTTPTIPQTLTSDTTNSSLSSPPTNIPPPALILSLFPPLFSSAESSFFYRLRQEPAEVQQAIYAEPAAITYLKGMLALATVCGRVIAGRKQRWKRDTILAQSMRIGPSAAGGVSGLKLTSIDKAENTKEERETADALKAWQAQIGKLKSAIAEVKRIKGVDIGKIPDLRETMPIKVAKEIEGGLKGNRPCALCGLKREERVLKVDFEVEDSFGEWWVENVSMHRACRNFWEQHRESLRQR
jgi:hypothetical protein